MFLGIKIVVKDLQRLTRFSAIPFAWSFVLMGAYLCNPTLGWKDLLPILGVATTFHIYLFITNDILDLDLDRMSPLRQLDPLVRGVIRPQVALAIAVGQILVAFVIVWLSHVKISAGLTLLLAFGFGTIYNIWGKRFVWPVIMGIVQGLSGAMLLLYSAISIGFVTISQVCILFIFTFVYIEFLNGVYGSIRDLATDFAFGAKTMATTMGARYDDGFLHLPSRYKSYATFLHLLLVAMPLSLPLIVGHSNFDEKAITLLLTLIFGILSTKLFLIMLGEDRGDKFINLGTMHYLLLLVTMHVAVLLFRVPWISLVGFFFIFFLPILTSGWFLQNLKGAITVIGNNRGWRNA